MDNNKRAEVEVVLAEFDRRKELLEALCTRTKVLIEVSLQDAGIRYQSVQARVKHRKKLKAKYEDPTKNYQSLADITDLAGLRVITYYEDDIDKVAEVIRREFAIDAKNTVDKRIMEPERFGYRGFNFVCRHTDARAADVEYKRFGAICCEIQVTSVLGHAWAEIEHGWYDLKDTYPDEIKRRFRQLSALLELADSQFMDIRNKRSNYERSVSIRVDTDLDIPLDSVSLRSLIAQDAAINALDLALAGQVKKAVVVETDPSVEMLLKSTVVVNLLTVKDLRDALEKYSDLLLSFCQGMFSQFPPPPEIRRGFCIWMLATMLTASRGSEHLIALWRACGIVHNPHGVAQVTRIATEAMSKTARTKAAQ